MERLELRLPPVVVAAICALAMWLVARLSDTGSWPQPGRLAVALLLAGLGLVVAAAGLREFRHARTTVNPLHPEQASAMVTGGIYGRTRNPMYLGMSCLLAAWAAWLGELLPFVLVLTAFVLYMNRFQIRPEERALEQRFGESFRGYAARVRRWI